jgi:hypothetical protein
MAAATRRGTTMLDKTEAKTTPFRLEEATIDDLQTARRLPKRPAWCAPVRR